MQVDPDTQKRLSLALVSFKPSFSFSFSPPPIVALRLFTFISSSRHQGDSFFKTYLLNVQASFVALMAHAWIQREYFSGGSSSSSSSSSRNNGIGSAGGAVGLAPLTNTSSVGDAWTMPFSIEQMQNYRYVCCFM